MKKIITTLTAVLLLSIGTNAQEEVDTLFSSNYHKFERGKKTVLYSCDASTAKAGNWFCTFHTNGLGEGDTIWCLVNNRQHRATSEGHYSSDRAELIEEFAILYNSPRDRRNYRYNNDPVFIPDGPQCVTSSVTIPLQVGGYPNGSTITSVDQIASICINIEHSYHGDLQFEVVCPNGSKSALTQPKGLDAKTIHSCLGIPFGGMDHRNYDGLDACDSADNPRGQGWNYCFSRRSDYTLGSGAPCNTSDTNSYTFNSATPLTIDSLYVLDSSNYALRSGYYQPAFNYDSLVGCPINGIWNLVVTDRWANDNGWLIGWDMDIETTTPSSAKDMDIEIEDIAFWVVSGDLSAEQPDAPAYSVYPNPTMGMLTIEGGDVSEVKVYDLSGRLVASDRGSRIDVSNLPKGTYLLKAQGSDNAIHTFKVVRTTK